MMYNDKYKQALTDVHLNKYAMGKKEVHHQELACELMVLLLIILQARKMRSGSGSNSRTGLAITIVIITLVLAKPN